MNSFSQRLEIILEQNSVESEVSTSNSALQEVYNDCLQEGKIHCPHSQHNPLKQHLLLTHLIVLI